MTSITWAGPRCVQELATILTPQNRIQGRCDKNIIYLKVSFACQLINSTLLLRLKKLYLKLLRGNVRNHTARRRGWAAECSNSGQPVLEADGWRQVLLLPPARPGTTCARSAQ